MIRRSLLAGAGSLAIVGPAGGQPVRKIPTLALFHEARPVSALTEYGGIDFFRVLFGELRRKGFEEGRNLTVVRFSGQGRPELFPSLAREVAASKPDAALLLTTSAAKVFAASDPTLPIVSLLSDPVRAGLVKSLARPGSNVTGVSVDPGLDLQAKRLSLIRELLPNASRIGFIFAANAAWLAPNLRGAASEAGVMLIEFAVETITAVSVGEQLAIAGRASLDAMIVSDGSLTYVASALVEELNRIGLPTIYPYPEFVRRSGLASYGPDNVEMGRRLVEPLIAVLGGANPGDIPILQPTDFRLILNLKIAARLGIAIPPAVLARADELIE